MTRLLNEATNSPFTPPAYEIKLFYYFIILTISSKFKKKYSAVCLKIQFADEFVADVHLLGDLISQDRESSKLIFQLLLDGDIINHN